jgi:hypothetical protein
VYYCVQFVLLCDVCLCCACYVVRGTFVVVQSSLYCADVVVLWMLSYCLDVLYQPRCDVLFGCVIVTPDVLFVQMYQFPQPHINSHPRHQELLIRGWHTTFDF